MNIGDLTVELRYSDDLQTSLLLAAVRVRDASARNDADELGIAIVRLTDVIQGIAQACQVALDAQPSSRASLSFWSTVARDLGGNG